MAIEAEGRHELGEREEEGAQAGGRRTERRSQAIAKWRIVPFALANVWVERSDGQQSHFSWTWLPVTWKLIS